ncbi:oligosaccharide flippase family protein [Vibrio sp. Sgm 5]|uniref:oligosaccharide flippase family protein n=1 Tax=Vibrio sp. Sgm 5 TaxID=2994387 RepID=UPI002249974B|nr:oligosaccharide flippase family protein [Vibrio sp. Sgm 5]MCX2792884.1 oligosaccharide flippase family protein [Vibrio sp. Sgm 5]
MSLKKNVVGLATAQIFNYVLPLLQFPYLTRTLGTELFGLVMFGLSATMLVQVITDYGFDISLTKEISERKRTKRKLGSYLYQSLVLKSLLLFISLTVITIVAFNSELKNYETFSLFIFFSIVINGIAPYWIFQSLEKSYVFARIAITFRVISLVLVFVLIKEPSDYFLYSAIMALTALGTCVVSYYIICNQWGIKPVRTAFNNVIELGKNSFEFFLSRVGASMLISSSTVFLGSFGTLTQVALYSSAEKLYGAGMGVFNPITSPLIPYMNRTKNYAMFYKIVFVCLSVSVLGVSFGFVFGDDVLRIIFGQELVSAKPTLDVMLISLAISVVGVLFGYPALMPLGKERHANISVMVGGLIHVIIVGVLIYTNNVTSLNFSISFCVSSIASTSYRVLIFIKNK